MKYTKYSELKNELKKLAVEIREWKNNRKLDKRIELGLQQWKVQSEVDWRKDEFRHKHIAYCLLRGREYEQIERFCRVAPNFDRIKKVMEEHAQETLCASA